jgi:hypothetical protein
MDNHLTNQEGTENEKRKKFVEHQVLWIKFQNEVLYRIADSKSIEQSTLIAFAERFALHSQRLIFFLNYLEEQGHIELWNEYLDADLQRGSYYSVSPIPQHLSQAFDEWRTFRELTREC